jgi:hypothetical protein
MRVDPLGRGFAAFGRLEQLLFEEGDQDVVAVLGEPGRGDGGGVDLVENSDLRVQVGGPA